MNHTVHHTQASEHKEGDRRMRVSAHQLVGANTGTTPIIIK